MSIVKEIIMEKNWKVDIEHKIEIDHKVETDREWGN